MKGILEKCSSEDVEEVVQVVTNSDIAAVVKNSRSRSGSPATCYDITKFEKEKSPFLAVKSLLKPFKKCRVSEQPEGLRESSPGQTQDIRKLARMLKSRGSWHKQKSKVDRQMHSLLSPGSQNSPWFSVIKGTFRFYLLHNFCFY